MGEMIVVRTSGLDDHLVIAQADPKIRIHTSFLQEVRDNPANPRADLTGDTLTLRGDNRTVVYRIDWYSFDGSTYAAEWHDPLRG